MSGLVSIWPQFVGTHTHTPQSCTEEATNGCGSKICTQNGTRSVNRNFNYLRFSGGLVLTHTQIVHRLRPRGSHAGQEVGRGEAIFDAACVVQPRPPAKGVTIKYQGMMSSIFSWAFPCKFQMNSHGAQVVRDMGHQNLIPKWS